MVSDAPGHSHDFAVGFTHGAGNRLPYSLNVVRIPACWDDQAGLRQFFRREGGIRYLMFYTAHRQTTSRVQLPLVLSKGQRFCSRSLLTVKAEAEPAHMIHGYVRTRMAESALRLARQPGGAGQRGSSTEGAPAQTSCCGRCRACAHRGLANLCEFADCAWRVCCTVAGNHIGAEFARGMVRIRRRAMAYRTEPPRSSGRHRPLGSFAQLL